MTSAHATQRARPKGATMRLDRMTTKSQEAIRTGLDSAVRRGNPEIIPEHVLLAALAQTEGLAKPLLARAGANVDALSADLTDRIATLPQVSGGSDPAFSRRFTQLVSRAEDHAK